LLALLAVLLTLSAVGPLLPPFTLRVLPSRTFLPPLSALGTDLVLHSLRRGFASLPSTIARIGSLPGALPASPAGLLGRSRIAAALYLRAR
jgi:hypothetical protein